MPDLSTYSWTEVVTATQPSPRVGHAMVWDPVNEKVILFGGREDGVSSWPPLDDTWEFDPVTELWTEVFPSTSPPARFEHVMVWDALNSRVLMHGGRTGATPPSAAVGDTWEYVPGGDWTELVASGPNPGSGVEDPFSGVWDTANDRFLLQIGWVSGATSENRIYEFDGVSSWSQITPSPAMTLDVASGSPDPNPRAILGQAVAWDSVAELLYAQGGEWTTDRSNDSTWSFDGTGYTQISGDGVGGTTPGTHRSSHTMVWAGDRVFLFGGNQSTVGSLGGAPSNVNYWFDGSDWALLLPAALPPARFEHAMVWTTDDVGIMFGGNAHTTAPYGDDFLDDTWLFATSVAPTATYKAINNTFGLN